MLRRETSKPRAAALCGGASRNEIRGERVTCPHERSAAGAGGQIPQVPGPEFYPMEWTSNGPSLT